MPIRAFLPPLSALGAWPPLAALLVGLAMSLTTLPAAEPAVPPAATGSAAPHTILFFGDSLTAGYGLANAAGEAFPALVSQKLRDAGLNYTAVNAGLSGDTSAGGLRRIDWLLQRPADILVLELGANDGLRGLPTSETARNLQLIIDKVRAKNPAAKVLVAGMRLPPSLGADYVAQFEAIFPALVRANPGATLLPFILEGVGGDPRYNQRDQIHPTAEGHRIVAESVWRALEPLCR